MEKPNRARKGKTDTASKPPLVTKRERMAKTTARPEGFAIEGAIETFGILPHAARALISIELRKKSRYGIAPAPCLYHHHHARTGPAGCSAS